jgi:hypothetical protein
MFYFRTDQYADSYIINRQQHCAYWDLLLSLAKNVIMKSNILISLFRQDYKGMIEVLIILSDLRLNSLNYDA